MSCNTWNESSVQNEQLNQHICNANFDDNNSKNQHISKVHDRIKESKYPDLKHSPNAKFLQASLLKIPLDYEGKKSFKCKFCPAYFTQKASLTKHIKSEHVRKNELLFCNTCNKRLMQNEQKHICDSNFAENYSKNLHISKVHDKVEEFQSPELKCSPNNKF